MPSLQRSLRRGQILPWALSLSALILAPASLAQGRPSAPTGSATGAEGTCPSRAYFGDTHVHTGWSADAGMDGAITTPEDAFRFARSETVKSNTGRSARLARPRRRPERRTAGGLPASDLGARPCGGDGGGGLWGAVLVPPALWVLPVAFPMVMALGGLMGLLGIPLPAVEVGIALSGIVLGLMVLLEQRPPLWVAALRDSLAFVVSMGLLHLEGILLGETRRRPGGGSLRAGRRWGRGTGGSVLSGAGRMIARLRKLPRLRSGAALIGGLILAMAPPPAAAHLMQTGFSGFYDGLTPLVAGAVGLRQSGEPSLDLLTTLSFALVGLLVALRLQLGVAGSWIAAAGLLRLG